VLVTAKNRTVPLSLPLGFFLVGEGFFLLASLLLALHPEAVLTPRHPLGLAAAHALFLGFGVGVLLGAMHQLVPVVLEVPLFRVGWGYPVLLLFGLGVLLLVLGFLAWPGLVPLGGALALLALLWFALHMLLTFRAAPRWNPVGTALAWTVFYLVLTPLLGLLQALTLRFGFYDPERLYWHLGAGLLGVFLLSVVGVGHKLVGMFTLSHGERGDLLGLFLFAANLGLLGLLLRERLGYLLLLVAYALALGDALFILRHRMKRALDLGVRHYLLALGFWGLSLLALPFRPAWAVAWFGLGFLGVVVAGMLYKILPFLVWTHRYAPLAGKARVPLLKEMLPEGAGEVSMVFLALGALLFPLTPFGGWVWLLGVFPHLYALWEVMRR
jgi:uncharacterized protein YggT (Ycf19 family)